jgi:uncharacterized protein YbjT (DUF2867 family)
MESILVLGGTGLLGAPAARRLRHDGFNVRVLSRNPAAAAAVLGEGYDILGGDVSDKNSVAAAMEGCHGVHISVGGPLDYSSAKTVAEVAPAAGVERVTYLSGSTVCRENSWFPMVEQKVNAEKALVGGETPHTILCPTWPMEQLPRFIIDGRATIIGEQPTPLHWVAADDLARMVSRAFQSEDAAGRRLYVHGPDGLTMKQALEEYCAAAYPEINSVTVTPIAAARAAAEATGNPVLCFMAEMMAYFDQAGELGDPSEANELLGAPTTTLFDWIERNVHQIEEES